jgi:hypothetical protein
MRQFEHILVYCVINPFAMVVIPAEAGIQKNRDWMPHQVRHDMPTKSKEALDALHQVFNMFCHFAESRDANTFFIMVSRTRCLIELVEIDVASSFSGEES